MSKAQKGKIGGLKIAGKKVMVLKTGEHGEKLTEWVMF
jgi:hypothetical protein